MLILLYASPAAWTYFATRAFQSGAISGGSANLFEGEGRRQIDATGEHEHSSFPDLFSRPLSVTHGHGPAKSHRLQVCTSWTQKFFGRSQRCACSTILVRRVWPEDISEVAAGWMKMQVDRCVTSWHSESVDKRRESWANGWMKNEWMEEGVQARLGDWTRGCVNEWVSKTSAWVRVIEEVNESRCTNEMNECLDEWIGWMRVRGWMGEWVRVGGIGEAVRERTFRRWLDLT